MKKTLGLLFTISVCLYSILHFFNDSFPSTTGTIALSYLGLLALVTALTLLPVQKMGVPLLILFIASTITLVTGISLKDVFLQGFSKMSGLIALLLIVPMISWTLKEESYMEGLMSAARNILNTSQRFYFGMLAMTQIIAYFLLFGAIPMVYQLVNGFLHDKKGEAWDNYRSTALLRGFALTTMWVISIPSFVFAVNHLGASLSISILQGFLISLCGLFLAALFSHFQEKKYGINITSGIKDEINRIIDDDSLSIATANKLTIEFAFLFISLFGTIFLLYGIFKWELLMLIPPTIVAWTCLYFAVKRKGKKLIHHGKRYFSKEILHQTQQLSILLSAGILIFAVNESGLGMALIDLIFYISDSIPLINILWLIPVVVIILGFLGLGPLTVIVLVTGILEQVSLPYSPELVVLSVTSGSVISILLSPFILPVIVLSAENGLGLFKNGFRFNIGYAIAFYIFVQMYLQLMVNFSH